MVRLFGGNDFVIISEHKFSIVSIRVLFFMIIFSFIVVAYDCIRNVYLSAAGIVSTNCVNNGPTLVGAFGRVILYVLLLFGDGIDAIIVLFATIAGSLLFPSATDKHRVNDRLAV